MGQFGSKGGLKKVAPLKKKKPAPKEAPDWRVLYTGIVNRVADLEVMNDTLFKRTSELAQSVVTIVDNLTTLHGVVETIDSSLGNIYESLHTIESLLEIK